MKIGYVGLGAMGGALAQRLAESQDLVVFDQSADAVKRLVGLGASAATDAASLARDCDVIFTCLPTSAIVRQAVFGPGGLAEGLSAGKIVIDQTTGNPAETRAIAAELAAKGVVMLDAPVSGGAKGALAGTIGIYCGGTTEDYERARRVLEAISPNIVYCGDLGTGHAAKIVQNAIAACNRVITLECAALACREGLTLDMLLPIIKKTSGWSGGAEGILPAIRTAGKTIDFAIGLMVKDLRLAVGIGNDIGAPMMIANAVTGVFQTCSNVRGPTSNLDEISHIVEEMAGITFTDHAGAGTELAA
jgi:3-hydroxyisobutyrate dehydrogenase